ncbi:MAG: hypothetical protein IJ214_06360 [Clostridia bacterium]|nr:hypothetical protein [Clostridia bacterium]
MKKLLVLLCALTLAAVSAAHAQADFTALCGGQPIFTLQYDEKAFSLDTESYLGSSVGGHTWLGMLFDGSATVEFSADVYADLPADCDTSRLADYLSGLLAGEQCAFLEQYTSPGQVPFVIFSLNGAAGQSYYAALLVQGYAVHFEIYNLRGGVGPEALATLKSLLDGVRL